MMDGVTCEFNSSYNSSSLIVFLCDQKSGFGRPTFIAKDQEDCEHIFVWRTNLTCVDKPSSANNNDNDNDNSNNNSPIAPVLISLFVIAVLGLLGTVFWKYLKNRRRRTLIYNNSRNGGGYISISNGTSKDKIIDDNEDGDDDDDDDDDECVNYSGSQTRVVSPVMP